MRIAVLLASSLLLFLSGCSDDGGDAEPVLAGDAPVAATLAPPQNITASESILLSVDATTPVGLCFSPLAACFTYDFTVNETLGPDGQTVESNDTVALSATLTWGLPINDLDLFLLEGDEIVMASNTGIQNGPGTSESIETELEPGDYTLLVTGYLVVADAFELTANFE